MNGGMKMTKLEEVVRAYFRAYELKKRDLIESLLTDDFRFNSPVDDGINRDVYFERCWPSCKSIKQYELEDVIMKQGEAIVRYRCTLQSGNSFENMELFRFGGEQIQEIVVYFGFDNRKDRFVRERVSKCNDAFLKGDADYIINRVAEDVVWELVGETTLKGKEEIRKMLEPMRGVKIEEHHTETILTQGNQAIVQGTMVMPDGNGNKINYAFCDMYSFKDETSEQIQVLKAFIIEINEEE